MSAKDLSSHESTPRSFVRHVLIAFGWLNVGLGVVGLFLPVMPTTVFLLIALWAFSRSSSRFHRWLFAHPLLGRPLRSWHDHRVIPWRAKVLAVTMLCASLVYLVLYVGGGWLLPLAFGVLAAGLCAFILTRPSRIPGAPPRGGSAASDALRAAPLGPSGN